MLEPFIGESGFLMASLFTIEALDQVEDYLILSATTDKGRLLDEETAKRFLSLPAALSGTVLQAPALESLENHTRQQRQATIQRDVSERNARFFEAETDKIDGWADDLKVGLEREPWRMTKKQRVAVKGSCNFLLIFGR